MSGLFIHIPRSIHYFQLSYIPENLSYNITPDLLLPKIQYLTII